jgi:hypothetical protein
MFLNTYFINIFLSHFSPFVSYEQNILLQYIMEQNINMVTPSVDAVPLTHMQKFKEGGVSKNTMHFDRMEDMITMCLSTFVHDYVHDYNLGSMHARVIKGNILRKNPDEPSLFEKLGINIENPIFKIMAYPIGGNRDISMYNDEQYEDVDSNDTNKSKFYDYLNGNERAIQTQTELVGGDAFVKCWIHNGESHRRRKCYFNGLASACAWVTIS